jgi:hypothetical protein
VEVSVARQSISRPPARPDERATLLTIGLIYQRARRHCKIVRKT